MGTVTKSIGTSSRDYSTLQAWEDALPANLVTDGNSQVGECYNDSEFVSAAILLTISGETTDSTHTITLKCASGQSFKDHANKATNRLAYNQSNGVGIRMTGGYDTVINTSAANVFIDGLQVKATGAPSRALIGVGCVVTNCILQSKPAASSSEQVVKLDFSSSSTSIKNSLVIADTSNACNGVLLLSGAGVFNCTVVRPSNYTAAGSPVKSQYATAPVLNSAFFGFSSAATGSFSTDGHNCTDLSSAPGSTSNQVSKTYANQFVQSSTGSSVEDFRIVANTADLYDTGATDTTNIPSATDIIGTSRPQGSAWDIGAWEFAVGGGGGGFQIAWARNSNFIIQNGGVAL